MFPWGLEKFEAFFEIIYNVICEGNSCLLRNFKDLSDVYQVDVFDVVESFEHLDCGSEPPCYCPERVISLDGILNHPFDK